LFTTEDPALGAYCRANGLVLPKVVLDETHHRCAMHFDDPDGRAPDLAREFAHRPDLHAFFKVNRDLVIAFGIAKSSPERWCSRALLDAVIDERQQRRRATGRPASTVDDGLARSAEHGPDRVIEDRAAR
jgi:hypothetical protein